MGGLARYAISECSCKFTSLLNEWVRVIGERERESIVSFASISFLADIAFFNTCTFPWTNMASFTSIISRSFIQTDNVHVHSLFHIWCATNPPLVLIRFHVELFQKAYILFNHGKWSECKTKLKILFKMKGFLCVLTSKFEENSELK